MDFIKFHPSVELSFFRGVPRSKIEKSKIPWVAKLEAFTRRKNDEDGLTVLPQKYLCYKLEIYRIASLKVGRVNSISNPENGQPLTVVQDEPNHAIIENIPAVTSAADHVIEVATALAEVSELLDEAECEAAKSIWLASTEVDQLNLSYSRDISS